MYNDTLAQRVSNLYNEVIKFKSSQPIGSSCSRVFDLKKSVSFPMDEPQATAVGAPIHGGLLMRINPVLNSGDFSLAEIKIQGDIDGMDIEALKNIYVANPSPLNYMSPFLIGYSSPASNSRTSSIQDFPITCWMASGCGARMRYIKVGINGNSINNGNHWVEVQAFSGYGEYIKSGTEYYTNLALNKPVTGQNCSSTANISRVTDGNTSSESYFSGGSNGYTTVTIDLGDIYYIAEIRVYFYYADNRTYYQATVSHGLTNVSGTANLATVDREPGDYRPYMTSYLRGWTIPTANLDFTVRTLEDGFLDISKGDAVFMFEEY